MRINQTGGGGEGMEQLVIFSVWAFLFFFFKLELLALGKKKESGKRKETRSKTTQ